MTKLILATLVVFISIGSLWGQVDDAKARDILNKVSAKAKTYSNMKFHFTYVMEDKKNKINDSLKGVVVMSGDKFNLDFMGRKIVSDGRTVWQLDQDAEEIQISALSKDQDAFNPGKLLTTYDQSYRSKLIKTVNEKGKQYHYIDLYPKEGKSYFKIRLKIDAKLFQVVEGTIFNKDNVTYTYIVNKFETNLKLSDNFFVLNPKSYPKFDIIDLR